MFLLVLCLTFLAACGSTPERFEYEQRKMGTTFRLLLYGPDREWANRGARAAFVRIDALERIFSNFDPASELSRLSRAAGGGPQFLSPELGRVLHAARDLSLRTGGAFDVTVGPYVRLWRRSARQGELPTVTQLARAGRAVGTAHWRFDREGPRAELLVPGMELDLGAIAKGYTLDLVLEELARQGIERALIDGGGDLRMGAPPPGRAGWRVAVQGQPGLRLELAYCAVATSGASARSLMIDGERYSHIIDPRTGLGSTRRAQATVIAPDALRADALASALCVLGASEGLDLIESIGDVESRVVVLEGETAATCDSSGFALTMVAASTRPDLENLR